MKKNYFFICLMFCSVLVAMESKTVHFKLLQAAKDGTEAQVEDLIFQGASVLATPSIIEHRNETALMVALNFKNKSARNVLINYRFEEQAQKRGLNGYALIHYVAGNHCLELLEPLKKLRIDINDRKNAFQETPLLRAIECASDDKKQKLEMIRQLLASGANPMIENSSEENAFTIARRQPSDIKEDILDLLNEARSN